MNSIVSFRECKLSNNDLLEKADNMVDGLFDYKHKHERERILTRHIPARPDEDFDLIIGELIVRFKEIEEAGKALLAEFDDQSVLMKTPIAYYKKFEKLRELLIK